MYVDPTKEEYQVWLSSFRDSIGANEHKTSPIVWFDEEGDKKTFLGGRDDTIAWCKKYVSVGSDEPMPSNVKANIDPWNPEHGFEYDLVVIGGGSGGLACSKEAAKLGAKVAVLDFVKPSPLGSKWGLGGTCVNVGCIPKKLMHNASVLGEHAKESAFYGWKGHEGFSHDWEALKNNVQDHIKGLNFGYRVALREGNVTYLNKLAKFISPHEIECTDAKGAKQTISAARIVVAVGGRPTPLECPGAQLALSSDDIFMKATPPGSTCVVGAGYVALECAGFLTGLGQGKVTVLVRSMMLRGFDREMVESIRTIMTHNGTQIIEGVLPSSIEQQPSGKLRVTMSNGNSEEFDTVLAAVGRKPDVVGLGLDAGELAVKLAPSGKILCTNEQTSIPHVYAIGDVVEGAPELTPVAIQAGRLLAQRLFGGSSETMEYKNIATTVFTPLEFGTVGLSEDEAIAKYGEANVDTYLSSFQPLEWSIVQDYGELSCLAKVIVDKSDDERVLGMHIAAPNAGEIIQGFAVAFRKGLYRKDLLDTIGIHPTTAEELCGLEVSKSSGKSSKKAGC